MVIGVAVPATCSLVSHNFCLVVSQLPAQVATGVHRNRFTSRTDKASHAITSYLYKMNTYFFLSFRLSLSISVRRSLS